MPSHALLRQRLAAVLMVSALAACSSPESENYITHALPPADESPELAATQYISAVLSQADALGLPTEQFDEQSLLAAAYLLCDSQQLGLTTLEEHVAGVLAAYDALDPASSDAATQSGYTRDKARALAETTYTAAMTYVCPTR